MEINLNNCTFLYYEQLYILLSENVVFHQYYVRQLLCRLFLSHITLDLMSLRRSSSSLFNCPNDLAYSGCRWWTYSRKMFSNRSPQNVSYWMRRASDTNANIFFVMPKEWRFRRRTRTLWQQWLALHREAKCFTSVALIYTENLRAIDIGLPERSTLLTDGMFSKSWQVWKLWSNIAYISVKT